MNNGLYTGAVGMIPQEVKQEIIANNLANVNTTGFKKEGLLFQRILEGKMFQEINYGNPEEILHTDDLYTNFAQGSLTESGNPLDMAIDGAGFFVIESPQGTAYTRNGNFRIDEDGRLITNMGYPVLGENGIIEIDQFAQISITDKGEILKNGVEINKMLVKDFETPELLKKIGNSLFVPKDQDAVEIQTEEYKIKQGFLEQSNVNPMEEMVEMLMALRIFEAIQKMINLQNETLGKATNELGRGK